MRLSRSAQALLLRLSFVSSALLLAYALYDNFLFWHLFPFYLQLIVDACGILFFCYAAVFMQQLLRTARSYIVYGAAFFWGYIVLTNAYGLLWYVQVIGTDHIMTSTGSLNTFLLYEITLTTLAPAILFLDLWLLLRRQ